ncbi:MAG: hypothetical protein DRG32_03910 [Deltaproteobacteria bacterium]|nr:MAG: hypothetical protein DRG32_03910 [Deltaproteobacteria bacterium]
MKRKESTQRRRDRREGAFLSPLQLLLILLLFLEVLFLVWTRLETVRLGYEISRLTRIKDQLERENRELRVEMATLSSAPQLEEKIRKELLLFPPPKERVIIVSEETP